MNKHQKDTGHNEIEVCVPNVDTIIGSIVDTIKRLYGREGSILYEHTSHSSKIRLEIV